MSTNKQSCPAKIVFVNAANTSDYFSSGLVNEIDYPNYPNLGLLTLMSSLKRTCPDIHLGYFDGTIYGNLFIRKYIEENFKSISMICFSVITVNYEVSVALANLARTLNHAIIIIFGNDHFSALYETIMKKQSNINFGFFGNDVVEGFTNFVADIIVNRLASLDSYHGLVYRNKFGQIMRNLENPGEYSRLPLVDYSLVDSLFSHNERYLANQQKVDRFIREKPLTGRGQVVDIGRGCIKFAGKRVNGIPVNTCDFCGIVPGSKAILRQTADRAWTILKNAYDQGYNYFFVTADDLPLTMPGLLDGMAASIPDWFNDLPLSHRPKMFGYARAEGFSTQRNTIDTMVNVLGFEHFYVGFDGLSQISLEAMNKQPTSNKHCDLTKLNAEAFQKIAEKGCFVTAGLVITHLGITVDIMEKNYQELEKFVSFYPSVFAALEFGPLCPIPGSRSFRYLIDPKFARTQAEKHGLSVNVSYLESIRDKYIEQDIFDGEQLIIDFILGCCPQITIEYVKDYVKRIKKLAEKYSIAAY